ncbi:type I polyketide synthase, partial [Streptomyces zhihengii]
MARWLAGRGVPHLVLTSRGGVAPEGLVEELTALGAQVTVAACDVADRDALAAVVAKVPAEWPLAGVVHAAGILDDGMLDGLSPQRLASVMRPKADGLAALDAVTAGLPLEWLVVFSSMAGTIGSAGQANYAAANAAVDAWVQRRRERGLPATSIAWGPWAESGMAADSTLVRRLHRGGIRPLDANLALRLFAEAIHFGGTDITVVDIDWDRFAPAFASVRPSPLLTEVAGAAPLPGDAAGPGTGLREQLAGVPEGRRRQVVLELVQGQAAAVLGHSGAQAVEPQRAFRDLGFDSLMAVELRNLLAATTGLSLPTTLVFDHPDPTVLSDYLLTQFLGAHVALPDRARFVPAATGHDEPVAIVGMACRYPGGVTSPEQLWDLVADGVDGITPFPEDRGWPVGMLDGTAALGGFVHDAGEFDAGLFGISPREALAMDPQQRLLLETAWETLESAGMNPRSLRGRDVGVFAGASPSGYGTHGVAGAEGHLLTGTAHSVVSGRLAYVFGLEGPAVTVDTACSSSLV